ncbi:ChbG/HpnK family deacetylase [Hwangdonia lutea]|uniref:ChbG/HpnK family deacetylase n=1 Tax=Hwangdonia lutea TaxID=3075823 RepID=A0AA97EKZ7_9FLAO|nr:ChbG/HpnK family deacetylase [Hwangdonia sp. SCSIO 19198]WOD43152.1 ChbG/HpnK family deacetylase [Hwangdonia sp. SCSIO 19198]
MINLIINADDFGMSKVYNKYILDLLFQKKITSTTVMVNRISDSQSEQVQQLKTLLNNEDVSVGLHTEFTYDKHLEQVETQYEKFINIFGLAPSHIDIHKEHLHHKYHPVVAEFCDKKGIPFRNHGTQNAAKTTDAKYFYGSIPNFKDIEDWIKSLSENKNYELVFHPGIYDKHCYSSLNKDRETDIEHIEKINSQLLNYNINLISFKQL